MEKYRKIELLQRSLGIRHKLRVHESMKAPDNHEEIARMMMGKWELEDELRAIEELLAESRNSSVAIKKALLEKEGVAYVRDSGAPGLKTEMRKVGE